MKKAKITEQEFSKLFKVEKDIPIPTTSWGMFAKHTRDFSIGDSVLCKGALIANSLITALKNHGYKVKTRKEDTGGTRVWRVE